MAKYKKKVVRKLQQDRFRDTTMGLFDRLGEFHHAELFACGRQDHTHLTGADPAIDTILDLNRETSFPRDRGAGARAVLISVGIRSF